MPDQTVVQAPPCKLCNQPKELKLSHIIPSFVIKWIKDTSATGFVRGAKDPNARRQDGHKDYLLCNDCEQIFSKHEKKFSSLFFYPYVNDVLDDTSNYRIGAQPISYDDWLIKFVISVQWRSLLIQEKEVAAFEGRKKKELDALRDKWREFLLGKSSNSGPWTTYLIPLASLADAEGNFPPGMHPKTNFYLLRSIDATIVSTKKNLGIFSKIGPIVLFTAIYPNSIPGMSDLQLRMKGKLNFVYRLENKQIAEFIFVTRPKEAMGRHSLSPSSQALIDRSYAKNPERVKNSKTVVAQVADIKLGRKLETD